MFFIVLDNLQQKKHAQHRLLTYKDPLLINTRDNNCLLYTICRILRATKWLFLRRWCNLGHLCNLLTSKLLEIVTNKGKMFYEYWQKFSFQQLAARTPTESELKHSLIEKQCYLNSQLHIVRFL